MSRYFDSPIRMAFLKYFLTFRNSVHFSEHTGFYCSVRYVKRMKSEFSYLESAYTQARLDFDMEKIAEMEMGKYNLYTILLRENPRSNRNDVRNMHEGKDASC